MAEPDLSKRIVYPIDPMREVRVRRDVVYERDAGTELSMNIYAPVALSSDARRKRMSRQRSRTCARTRRISTSTPTGLRCNTSRAAVRC